MAIDMSDSSLINTASTPTTDVRLGDGGALIKGTSTLPPALYPLPLRRVPALYRLPLRLISAPCPCLCGQCGTLILVVALTLAPALPQQT